MWKDLTDNSASYIVTVMIFGYFCPLAIIMYCYRSIYNLVQVSSFVHVISLCVTGHFPMTFDNVSAVIQFIWNKCIVPVKPTLISFQSQSNVAIVRTMVSVNVTSLTVNRNHSLLVSVSLQFISILLYFGLFPIILSQIHSLNYSITIKHTNLKFMNYSRIFTGV